MKVSILFLAFSVVCVGQPLWHGTRWGMSRAELEKLFGTRLKAGDGQFGFNLYGDEQICGADFKVVFGFFNRSPAEGDRLGSVSLFSRSSDANGVIGKCVLDQFTAKLGSPLKVMDSLVVKGEKEYWFGNWFVKKGTVLYIGPTRVVISISRPTHARHPWYADFP
jgi:hypothetical protein